MGSRINAARGPRDMDQDLLLALCLQAEEEEVARGGAMAPLSTYKTPVTAPPEKSLSVVDPSWELLDPSPDVRALFLQFNQLFFWGKLAGVEVKWSSRMTLCAGVCSYEGRGGLCSIRLSGPLLKLRPRKDLVETLLHEMIHALLFVTHNDRDHDAHGDEFCKHMRRINGITGAKISVYHDFHDEVDEYRKHWWLCNGPCQKKRPYFGYVKRAMNRAPSANDTWWAEHKQTCGGTFTKVKEPENYSKKGNGKSSLPSTQNPKMGTSQSQKLLEEKGNPEGVHLQTIIPFSGKGYKLGEQSATSHWAKVRSPGNILKPETECVNSSLESHVRFSQTSASRTQNNTVSGPNKSHGNEIVIKKKKISVANTKAFKNINGSPVRILPVFGSSKTSNQPPTNDAQSFSSSNMAKRSISFGVIDSSKSPAVSEGSISTRVFPVFGNIKPSVTRTTKEVPSFPSLSIAQKRTSNHDTATSPTIPSSSQGSRSINNGVQPNKRPKMDNERAIADFFAKPPNVGVSVSGSSCTTSVLGSTGTEVTSSTVPTIFTSSLSANVSCPICQTQVLQSKINQHLDSCLTNSFLSEEAIF